MTTLAGQVMDPGLNVGLRGAEVYVLAPGSSPIAIADEPGGATLPTCDSCAALLSPALVSTQTLAKGDFSLEVPPGTYTVIAQIGRWRRIATDVVATCGTTTTIPNATISMPSTETLASGTNQCRSGEASCGDIPKIALVEGAEESLECWLLKVGIAASEFAPYAAGATQRIQLYDALSPTAPGGSGGPGEDYWDGTAAVVPPPSTSLSKGPATLNSYSEVLFACDGVPPASRTPLTAAVQTAMINYGNAGGRLFLDHDPAETWVDLTTAATPLVAGSLWSTAAVATWAPGAANPALGVSQTATVLDVSADQQGFYSWLSAWDTTDAPGTLVSASPRNIVSATGADSIELAQFASIPSVASFFFNTPVTASSSGAYCGRVVVNDMHVSPTRSTTTTPPLPATPGTTAATTFPGSCSSAALNAEELAFEYELFALSQCNLSQ